MSSNNRPAAGWQRFPAIAILSLVAACTGMRPGFETPSVTVSSFRALPAEGALPSFEIGLRVINPNPEALRLRGVSYSVSLEGHELMKAVANDLPVIDAYGEGEIRLVAAANLFAGIRLITELMGGQKDTVGYSLDAKLDVGAFLPAIRVRDTGEVSLRSSGGT